MFISITNSSYIIKIVYLYLQCISDSQCCGGIWCHKIARRCQVRITEEELMAQRKKILGRSGKDY